MVFRPRPWRFVVAVLLMSWISPSAPESAPSNPFLAATPTPGWLVAAPSRGQREAKIRKFANRWLGTRYRWGGTGRSGIDCSGYLREMYRELFNVELPRTTRQQIQLGMDLRLNGNDPAKTLEPGDLLFYVDAREVPNHVVVYAGNNQITHSVSGRGVVMDPISKIWGRKVVARRFLVPLADSPGFESVPIARGPIRTQEIPCPARIHARRGEVALYAKTSVDFRALGEREICDFRALAKALRKSGGSESSRNAAKLDAHIEWLQSIEALKGELGGSW